MNILLTIIWSFAIIFFAGMFFLGKSWECWPAFEVLSGKKRFKQFIASRIPESITGIRGGFSGFFSGEIYVLFYFRECLEKELFLAKWEDTPPPNIFKFIFKDKLDVTKSYYERGSPAWLFVDESQKKALLYVPSWHSINDLLLNLKSKL